MRAVVCIKQVPDTQEIQVDFDAGVIKREGVPLIMNPFDEYAVEEAVRLKEKHGGTVTAVTVGPPSACTTSAGWCRLSRRAASLLRRGVDSLPRRGTLCAFRTAPGTTGAHGPHWTPALLRAPPYAWRHRIGVAARERLLRRESISPGGRSRTAHAEHRDSEPGVPQGLGIEAVSAIIYEPAGHGPEVVCTELPV